VSAHPGCEWVHQPCVHCMHTRACACLCEPSSRFLCRDWFASAKLRASGWVDALRAGCPHYRMCHQPAACRWPSFLRITHSTHPLALLTQRVQQRSSASQEEHVLKTQAALVLEAATVCSAPWLVQGNSTDVESPASFACCAHSSLLWCAAW
jgi:hypothetical protein